MTRFLCHQADTLSFDNTDAVLMSPAFVSRWSASVVKTQYAEFDTTRANHDTVARLGRLFVGLLEQLGHVNIYGAIFSPQDDDTEVYAYQLPS